MVRALIQELLKSGQGPFQLVLEVLVVLRFWPVFLTSRPYSSESVFLWLTEIPFAAAVWPLVQAISAVRHRSAVLHCPSQRRKLWSAVR